MSEQRVDQSLRKLLGALAGGLSAVLASRIQRAAASDKMTRRQAEYQDTPNGIYSCAVCTLFEPPKDCKVVEGEVSKNGGWKAFALAD
jgi:hypothetical protein